MKPPVMAEHHHGGMEPPRSSYLMEVHWDPGEHRCLSRPDSIDAFFSEHGPGSRPQLVLGRKLGSDIVIKSSNTITLFPQANEAIQAKIVQYGKVTQGTWIDVYMGTTYHTMYEKFKVFDTDDPSSISEHQFFLPASFIFTSEV